LLEPIGTEYVTRYAKFKRFRWEELWDESEEQIRLIPLRRKKKGC
jgi:hypothetical protein